MELDKERFRMIEIASWLILATILILVFWHFLLFAVVCFVIRELYMKQKNYRLGSVDSCGKHVLITGCDSGFGHAMAKRLNGKGIAVFAACLDPNGKGAKELQALRGRLRVLRLDIGKDESVAACLRVVKAECDNSGLWGLLNNAGVNTLGDCELSTMTQYLQVANVNLFGTIRMCRAFLPLLRQAQGRIVNVTSVKGICTYPSNASYNITKYAGEAFSEILKQETSQFGVTVSIIEPGNFGGITGCLNESGMRVMESLFNEMWEEASEDTRLFYGHNHLKGQLAEARQAAKTSSRTIEPVLDAYEDALFSHCPRFRYLVPGSNSYVDKTVLFARIAPYIPQTLFDKAKAYYFPYVVHRQ